MGIHTRKAIAIEARRSRFKAMFTPDMPPNPDAPGFDGLQNPVSGRLPVIWRETKKRIASEECVSIVPCILVPGIWQREWIALICHAVSASSQNFVGIVSLVVLVSLIAAAPSSFHDLSAKDIDGVDRSLAEWKGKVNHFPRKSLVETVTLPPSVNSKETATHQTSM
jgi:hypothetical protein